MKILFALLIIGILFYVPIYAQKASVPVTNNELDEDWKEIQGLLKNYVGVYKGDRVNIETTGLPDAPLLGNGNIGVVSNGTGSWQEFHISSVNFWDGRYTPDPVGEIETTGYNWGSNGIKSLPIGGVTIYENIQPENIDNDSSIVQYQDILNAEIRTEASVNIRTWVSATDQIIVSEITNNNKKPVPISVETWTKGDNPTYTVYNDMRWSSVVEKNRIKWMSRDNPGYAVESGATRGMTWATRETTNDTTHKFVCRAALVTKVFGADASTQKIGDNTAVANFELDPGKTVKVVTFINVVKDDTNHLTEALGKALSYNEILINQLHTYHLDWWKDFWLKSYVRMYDEQLEKYYFGALYETACSNRTGNLPSPLHGPFITTDYPNWKSNYKLSYNFQMTYSGVCSSNRPELLRPYVDLMLECAEDAQRRSESGYEFNLATGWRWRNADGTLKFPNGIKGGLLYPLGLGPFGFASEDSYSNIVGMGTWAAAPCIWYYNATRDENFLSTKLYPFLKKLATFWETYLVKENGKWVVKYSGASERSTNDGINSPIDIATIKYLFSTLIPMSESLNIDNDRRNLWGDIVDNMSSLPITKINGKTIFGASDQGMGFSSVFVSYPGREVTLSSDNKTKEIFKNTIDYVNSWDIMNAPGFLWAVCAHGGYPAEDLLRRFRTLLSKSMLRNMVVRGNFHGIEGAASLEYINCSMMDSYEEFIRIFPLWPLDNAKFSRLRANGAFLVSAKKINGSISDVKVYSEKGNPCTVLNPWPNKRLKVYDGNSLISSSEKGGRYTFNTVPDHEYLLTYEK